MRVLEDTDERVTAAPVRPAPPSLTGRQWLTLVLLAAVQFTHVLDFMIVMPLEPRFEAELHISTEQFGFMVSVYGLAASLAALLLASWLDRFDRKATLLALYAGFTISTFLCGVAPNFKLLMAARALAGAFGGVVAGTLLAIVGDAFPPARRATATGAVMSAWSVASIVGVPAGLLFAHGSSWGWRGPFLVLAVLSAAVFLLALFVLPSVRGHLEDLSLLRPGLWNVIREPRHLRAYALMGSLVLSTFTVGPYLAAFFVKNLRHSESDLFWVYLCGGTATLVTMNLIGRLADRVDRLLVFRVMALATAASLVLLTNLPEGWPLTAALTATTLFMVMSSGRMVPAVALITSSAAPQQRGSFLSVSTAMQQLAAGVAPLLAGLFLGESREGQPLEGFATVGAVAVAITLGSIVLAGLLRSAPTG
jgi:predicted MFS family arabinose efflux permease